MIVNEMTNQECHEFLKQINLGRLGCARGSQPYVVPIYFVSDDKNLYCFSTLGQKIEWMRTNPLVCVEVDEVVDQFQWRSVVVLGKYEELSDVPSCARAREYALKLLQKRVMWWQPAYVATEHGGSSDGLTPIFYRIRINQVTGHRGMPDVLEGVGSKAALNSKSRAKWSLFSRWR